MSTISFLPFINENLSQEYVIPVYIGEGFSSLVPSLIVFVQGINRNQQLCQNMTYVISNLTFYELKSTKPASTFSVSIFFSIITLFFILSFFSFVILNKKLRPKQDLDNKNGENMIFLDSQRETPGENVSKNSFEIVYLLILTFIISFFMYGVLLGLQSYSTLAYSHLAFNLSINLGNLMLPMVIFFSIVSYKLSLWALTVEFFIALLISVYIVFISFCSPCPPLMTHWSGSFLIVLAWIVSECLFLRLRCVIAATLEKYGQNILLVLGWVTLLGQVCGGIVVYILVDIMKVFVDRPDCQDQIEFCHKFIESVMDDQYEQSVSLWKQIVNDFKIYNSNVNWFVFVLVVIFSWGGWIEIFGIWAELPLIVNSLPEGWRLPSILTGATQIGQIGSLAYLLLNQIVPKHFSLKRIIFVKLITTTVSTLILSFVWKKTYFIFGEERSVGLLSLVLVFSLCDGFSTISTIPFITKFFKKEYIIPYYIGEALFALIPSVIAIIQGAGDDLGCQNVVTSVQKFDNFSNAYFLNETFLEPIALKPIFSVKTYFLIIFGFLSMSLIAFTLLNSSVVKKEKNIKPNEKLDNLCVNEFDNPLLHKPKFQTLETQHRKEKNLLLSLNFFITFCFYGILPGVQSYSTLPYGNNVFHLSINLSNILLPIAIFLSVWSYNVSLKQILIEFSVAVMFSAYIVFISFKSPCPPFLDSKFGPVMICASWILSQAIFMRVRCIISTRLERFGEKILLKSGSLTLLGEVVGGILIFLVVEKFRIFEEKPECVFDLSYCSWLDISGIWCELPFMIHDLPEGWRLPSILSAISQFAQIGPFVYLLIRYFFPTKIDNVKVIYLILITGAVSCLLLAFFWNKTVLIHEEKRSIYLYIFHFTLSLLDGMSTLTFLPYIGEYFAKEYIIPNYIGESFSSLVPAVLALIQGFHEEDCDYLDQNKTSTFKVPKNAYKPKYSVLIYFLLIFFLLLISIMAFSYLNFSKYARRARKNRFSWVSTEFALGEDIEEDTVRRDKEMQQKLNIKEKEKEIQFLFILTFMVTFVYYGFLPGLMSYSTIPYSNKFFHLSINLSNILLPFSIILSIFSYEVSIQRICLESILPFILAFYIYLISVFSPCPPFVSNKNEIGGYLIVICWIVSSLMFMRIRCLIATKLGKYGKNILFKLGCFTILGQVFGGLIIFMMVDYLRLFIDKPKCAPINFCY
ncbi:riboflavin transporter 2-like [Brachionus plicatilis]|uniref:Riboflavin transporter 2-like n=1 Tax=Brachionus plicatilis TaxID=10195 RepID=A0A3M7QD75_BRAPC|nr:riboflavin transporter 2-like [Brachionus plicatilis]